MPEISRFFGIKIQMHFGSHEHPPAHFHARSSDGKACFTIDGALMEGRMPPKEIALVRQWAAMHVEELQANWELCTADKSPFKIAPLP